MMRRLSLVTVCEEARCPNIHECWARERTATFMLMGDICTRHCGFCAVGKGAPGSLDPEEPARVAEAARELGLSHAVVTSVNRDDLPDGGAAHFAATIRAIRERNPGCTVEVLIPDFQGNWAALDTVLAAGARDPEPQHRDGAPAVPAGASGRACTPSRSSCSPARARSRRRGTLPMRTKSGTDGRPRRDRRRSWSRRSRTCAPPAATSRRSASTSSPTSAGSRSSATTRPAEFDSHPRARARPWASSGSRPGPLVRSSYHARRAFAPASPAA